MTYTPGPWDYLNDHIFARDRHVARCLQGKGGSADDARLIAAAPELLEALRWLLNEVERERDYEHWQAVIDPAREAIAKAEGRT